MEPSSQFDSGLHGQSHSINNDERRRRISFSNNSENHDGQTSFLTKHTNLTTLDASIYLGYRFISFVLPSFLHAWVLKRRPKERELRRTSFLDGMRGWAALMVVVLHQMGDKPYWFSTPYSHGPYHPGEEEQHNTNWIQFPWIRSIYHFGHMIPVFFVVSGYVLSFRSIQYIRRTQPKNKYGKLAMNLFWSSFRRTFRLFVPSMVGLWYNQVLSMLGIGRVYNYRGSNFMGYVKDYFGFLKLLFGTIWHFDGPRTNALHQFWTIPVEYSCSLGLFALILVTSWMPAKLRMFTVAVLMVICARTSHHGFMGFFSGLFLADLEESYVEREKQNARQIQLDDEIEIEALLGKEPAKEELDDFEYSAKIRPTWFSRVRSLWVSQIRSIRLYQTNSICFPRIHSMSFFCIPKTPRSKAMTHKIFWIIVFITSWYVMGWPWYSHERDPIILWLDRHVGGSTSVYAASFAFVGCGFRFKWLQRVFTSRVALYLGDISYSMYIVHLSLLFWNRSFIKLIVIGFGADRRGHVNRIFSNLSEIGLFLILVVWVADMFWRAVDVPSVKLARLLEQKIRRQRPIDDGRQGITAPNNS